jgi:large subunit ribosomal protein L17
MAARRGGRPVTSVRVSRKFVRRGFKLGAVIGAVFFLAQVFLRKQAPKPEDNATRTPVQPKLHNATPETPAGGEAEAPSASPPSAAEVAEVAPPGDDLGGADAPWVDPLPDGGCPADHPVKAKLSSKIFHVPGGLAYDRTTPDRCYRDAATAEADGFRAAKR